LVAVIVFAEWAFVIGRSRSIWPATVDVATGAVFVVLASLFAGSSGPVIGMAIALAGVLGVAVLSRSAWLCAGCLYAGLFGVALAALRSDPALGLQAITVLLIVVWGNDSFAYLAGRRIGGPKLWPRVSPKKTWSGSIGGLMGGVLFAALCCWLIGVPVGVPLVGVLVALSVLSQIGDLGESALKRHFDRKDSSNIIPGHGGMMDRVDGLIVAVVAAMLIGWLHTGSDALGRGLLIW
jgi:phosphatidate cytidylyltransferase